MLILILLITFIIGICFLFIAAFLTYKHISKVPNKPPRKHYHKRHLSKTITNILSKFRGPKL